MKVAELIAQLQACNPEMEVEIVGRSNGEGRIFTPAIAEEDLTVVYIYSDETE